MYKKKLLLFGILVVLLSPLFVTSVSAGFVGGGGGGGGNPVEKYGFFFWTSWDVGTQESIDFYESVLQSKGYTTYEFKDLTHGTTEYTIDEIFVLIDSIEDYNDILFFYFAGHGDYHQTANDYSEVWVTPATTLYSVTLKAKSYLLETTDVSIFVQACHAGDFVDEFEDRNGYLVMTASSEHTESFNYHGVSYFSSYFFGDLALYPGHSAVDAFYNAKLFYSVWFPRHYPEIVDNSDYDFF